MKKIITLGFVCMLLLSGCSSDTTDEKKSDETKEVKKEEDKKEITDEASFIDALAVEINGVEVKLPMEEEEFFEKTGLEKLEDKSGAEVYATDGYSTFVLIYGENGISGINVYANTNVDKPEICNYDSEKTSVVFPYGVTINNTETEIKEIYDALDYGIYTLAKPSTSAAGIWLPTLDTDTYGLMSLQCDVEDDVVLALYYFKYE